MARETRFPNLPALMLALLLLLPGALLAGQDGDFEDPFGDLSRTQQQRGGLDDEVFAGVINQDISDFHDVSQHGKPVRRRARSYPGAYRFFDTDFDVFWDTVAFRSRESQGEGAALITLMFKDVVWFDPARRRSGFAVDAFVDIAMRNCSTRRPNPRVGKGPIDGGFTGFSTEVGATFETRDQSYLDRKTTDGSFDFDLGVSVRDDGYGSGDPRGFENPLLSDGDALVFRSDRYVMGGYQGLYDFSRERSDLVKNFLVRAAQDSHYERLYENAFFAPDERTAYAQIKNIIQTRRLPVLALLPRQRDAVLIYRVIERGDGLGAMLYWRPSDPVNQRVSRELGRQNVIWAVPQAGRGITFIDRADLENRRFRFGNHSTMVIVPNLCRIYARFANTLRAGGGGFDGPDYRPPRKGDDPYYPPDYDQGPRRPFPPDYDQGPRRPLPPYVPDCFPDQRRNRGGGLDWMVDLVFGGGRNGINIGIGNRPNPPRRPPPFMLDPPRWEPMPPPIYDGPYPPPGYQRPPPDRFRYRPPVKNPYCNKPVGTGRGKFVYIGFGFDERGFNEWGFDVSGLNAQGFDPWGFDKQGYGQDGFDPWGYDRGGYDRRGFPLFNRARAFVDLVNQYHRDPFAFRMQFDIKEDGSIIRIVDGAIVWNQGGAVTPGPGVLPPGTVAPPVAPPIPGPQKAEVPEFRTVTITGKIKGLAAPYEIQIDRASRYHILKDGKRTSVPRNINVNADFEMQFQDKTKDFIFIQSTPATK